MIIDTLSNNEQAQLTQLFKEQASPAELEEWERWSDIFWDAVSESAQHQHYSEQIKELTGLLYVSDFNCMAIVESWAIKSGLLVYHTRPLLDENPD